MISMGRNSGFQLAGSPDFVSIFISYTHRLVYSGERNDVNPTCLSHLSEKEKTVDYSFLLFPSLDSIRHRVSRSESL